MRRRGALATSIGGRRSALPGSQRYAPPLPRVIVTAPTLRTPGKYARSRRWRSGCGRRSTPADPKSPRGPSNPPKSHMADSRKRCETNECALYSGGSNARRSCGGHHLSRRAGRRMVRRAQTVGSGAGELSRTSDSGVSLLHFRSYLFHNGRKSAGCETYYQFSGLVSPSEARDGGGRRAPPTQSHGERHCIM